MFKFLEIQIQNKINGSEKLLNRELLEKKIVENRIFVRARNKAKSRKLTLHFNNM